MQVEGGSLNFMQGKRGGHINLCTHIRELCYTKGERVSQKCASHRGGSGEFEFGLLPFASALPPLKLIMISP